MSKRGRRRGRSASARSIPDKLARGMYEASKLMERKKYVEARDAFQDLDRRFPNQEDALRGLANACYEIRDTQGYQYACEHLIKLAPDEPEIALGLAGAYMTNLRLTLALRAFRHFLERWPEHKRAADARKTLAELEPKVFDMLRQVGFTENEFDELGALHEEAQVLMEQGRYAEARQMAEKLIARKPQFMSPRNNLSLMYAFEGDLNAAIATAHQVLSFEPENYHALGNLVRFHVQTGRLDEARQHAERLKPVIETEHVDIWVKKIEALSYLGDDQGVIDVFDQAERSNHRNALKHEPLIFHLAAVAEMRLGREEKARELWRRALKVAPGLDPARANFDDLKNPAGERDAPWPFPLTSWITRQAIDDLHEQLKLATGRGGNEGATQAMRRYFEQHPELATLIPVLFDRGDSIARGLALRLASLAKTPEMLEALRDFALSQRGTDALRMEAAQIVSQADLIPGGYVRMWIQGEWREIMLLGFEIHGEPEGRLPLKVERLVSEGMQAVYAGEGAKGEQLLKQALEMAPGTPSILNNLAAAYSIQGKIEEGENLIEEIHRNFPDYLFGRTNLAVTYVHKGRVDEAEELISPLLQRKRLHFSELGALCGAQIEISLARKNRKAARDWFKMWEQADPDNPQLAQYRPKVERPALQQMLGMMRR